MTAPTLSIPDFTRDEIINAAFHLCGLLPYGKLPSADQIAQSVIHLNLALAELQSDNISLSQVENDTLALTSGTAVATYALEADALAIQVSTNGLAGTISDSTDNTVTQVRAMTRDEYMVIPNKTATGRPSRVFVDKQNATSVTFWPIPSAATYTFNFSKIRLLRQSDTGAVTSDLRRVWAPFLVYSVAVGVALDNSKVEMASVFKSWAGEKKELARAGDTEFGTIRFRIGHRGKNWS